MSAPANGWMDAGGAGVFRLPPRGADALCRSAARAGFACLRADLAGVRDKPALLARLADALAFPDWFGHNWDALEDCLGDLGWLPAPGYVLILEHADALRRADALAFATALDVFESAAARWREAGLPFWTFIDAGGERLRESPPLP